jgi:hypothetical protein
VPIFVTTIDGHRHRVKAQGDDESAFESLVNQEGPYSKGWVELDMVRGNRNFVNLRHVMSIQLTEDDEAPAPARPVFTDE